MAKTPNLEADAPVQSDVSDVLPQQNHSEKQLAGQFKVLPAPRAGREDLSDVSDILDFAGEALIGLASDGKICAWNARSESLFGWPEDAVLGRPLIDTLIAPSFREQASRSMHQLLSHDVEPRSGPAQLLVRHRDGREFWVESRIARLTIGGRWRYMAFVRDITAQKQTNDSLVSSEALYRLLAEHSGDLITRHTRDGRVLYVSPSAEGLLGRTAKELLGTCLCELLHPEDRTALQADMAALDRSGRTDLTFRLHHKDGHWVWFEALVSVVPDSHGAVAEFQVCSRDITDRRARDAAIHQDSKLESLGRLSAGLAHEINSPIQFVGDNARFLEEAYQELIRVVEVYRGLLDSSAPISWAERQERVREAEASIDFNYLETEIPSAVAQTLEGIERVSTIVRAMKTFSHPGHTEQVHADLNEALEATLTVTRHQVKEVAEIDLDLGELPPVRCNVADLNQVFLNLIVNAADAIEETSRPGTIGVSTRQDGDHVVIAISDTGGGIPEHIRSKIFDPFFTTKEVGRGSGQGLPLARGVIHEGHGGTLAVDSTVGVGTTFTIRLPVDGKP